MALKIDTDNANWKADGIDLQHLRIYAVDSKGRRVYTAVGDVKVEVNSEAATLVAMGSGNQVSDELHVTNHRMLYNGSVQAILRSGIDGGDVNITATCDGLKPAKIKLKVKP